MLDKIADGIGSFVNTFNPLQYFKEGAARDEARTVRSEDRADANLDRSMQWQIAQQNLKKGLQGSYSPIGAIGQDSSYVSPHMGQNISSSQDKRTADLIVKSHELTNEGLELDNLKKLQDLGKSKVQPVGRPVKGQSFMPGHSQGTTIEEKPLERVTSLDGYSEPGAVTSTGYSNFPDNSVMVTPSGDLKQRIEDDTLAELGFHINARTPLSAPPKSALPKGFDMWSWNPITNVFTPDKSPAMRAYTATKGKFMRYKMRKVKNSNPFYGGYTTEGYLEEGGN